MNFYERLKLVCDEKNKKITTVVVDCGGNKGSIASWKKGTVPNYTIIEKLAVELDVSVDFLVGKEEVDIQPKKYFNTLDIMLASKYKYINLSCLNEVPDEDIKKYAEYLNCSPKFMYNRTSVEYTPVDINRTENDIDTEMTDEIIDVMSFLPGSDDVRFIQIQISRIVIYNLLALKNKGAEIIDSSRSLNSQNLKFFLSNEFDYIKAKAYGFTSDEIRSIRRNSGLSYQYLFSGVMKDRDKAIFEKE
jgi:hypothetical protein